MKEEMIRENSLAICYEVDDTYDSDRFIKLKLNVMHDGKNFNMSSFSKKSIENAKSSIFNIPILAHVLFDEDNKPKFGGHDKHIEKDDDGNVKIVYDELPIGLVPESTSYEVKKMDDEKYHLFVDAYVWKGYSNYAEDIINEKEEIGLSMEIIVDKYTFDLSKNVFDITDYRYQGITLLGDDRNPAMEGANATATFDSSLSYAEVIDKMKVLLESELSDYDKHKEGGSDLEEEKQPKNEMGKDDKENIEENPVVEHSVEYSTAMELFKTLSESISKLNVSNDEYYSWYYLKDYDDKYVYLKKCEDKKVNGKWEYVQSIVRRSYSIVDGDVSIGTEEVKMVYKLLTEEEANSLEEERQSLETQLYELKEYKQNKIKEERENSLKSIFEKFDDKLNGNETYESLKENEDLSPEEIEDKCYSLVGRLNFNLPEEKQQVDKKEAKDDNIELAFEAQEKNASGYEYADLLQSEYEN